ncbi:MAG: tRNA1(Val) (adenine(37)-N6)-methyltransferase [Rhodomicrobium sp.]
MDTLETTRDAFLNGRIHVRQPAAGFRSGLDAVFLAAACPARGGDAVLEAGCGAGAASLCLLARVENIAVTGIEADPALAVLARQNALENGFGESFEAVVGDVMAPWSTLDGRLRREAYDRVIANPPFYAHGRARLSKEGRNARSRAMPEGGLDLWLRFLASAAKPGGTATVIHTAEAVPQLLNAFEGRFGGLRLIPLHPKAGAPAIRVILCGIKGSRAPFSLGSGIVLHEEDGTPAPAAKAILRDGVGLF